MKVLTWLRRAWFRHNIRRVFGPKTRVEYVRRWDRVAVQKPTWDRALVLYVPWTKEVLSHIYNGAGRYAEVSVIADLEESGAALGWIDEMPSEVYWQG